MSKESQLMRMPSDFSGRSKDDPCKGCEHCQNGGWCVQFKKFCYLVKTKCKAPVPVGEERRIRCIDMNVTFDNINDAVKETKVAKNSIYQCLSGRYKVAGKMRWEYAD